MKKIVLRFRIVDRKNFNELRKGLKVVETRAGTEKYKNIKKGDILVIVCGKQKIEKKIKKVRHFKSIAGLLKAIPVKKIMPGVRSTKEAEKIYHGYPGYKKKIKKFGLVAFEI